MASCDSSAAGSGNVAVGVFSIDSAAASSGGIADDDEPADSRCLDEKPSTASITGKGSSTSEANSTVDDVDYSPSVAATVGSTGCVASSHTGSAVAVSDSAVEEAAVEVDRLSIDDVSIASVQSGGGGSSRRQSSVTSRSSNCSSSLSVNAVATATTTSFVTSVASSSSSTSATTMTTASSISNGFATSSMSVASSSSSSASFRSLPHSGVSTPSNLEVGLHQPTNILAPPACRASPLAVAPSSAALSSNSSSSSSSTIANSCVINLNVGGFTFSTSLSTLVKYEDSMLAVMFSGRHPFSKDREGRYFIDRDGQYFGHILSYLRSDALPPEDVAQFVLREAEFFCLQSLIEKLESSSPRVIAVRRREYFRALIPDYDSIKKSIVGVASQKRTSFDESIVVLTQDNHAKLQGSIPCYNCTREPVCVTHDCTFKGNKSDITVKVKTQEINMDKMIGFIVNELSHDGFRVDSTVVLCKFSLRCHSCTMSGLYTAGGILAPRECPNMAHLLTFSW